MTSAAFRGVIAGALALSTTSACVDKETTKKMIEAFQSGRTPDSLPVMLNTDLPFRYPPELFDRKVQGNVTLRIHIDSTGAVHPDSTSVVESSGYASLDSSAVAGARELRFRPAIANGAPLAISVLFPVYFRHPEGKALPGDTSLQKLGARDSGLGTRPLRPSR